MKSLMFLIYLSAMGVAILLRQQSRRQKAETALESARLGLRLPPSRPRVQVLESLLNMAIGLIMAVPAALGFWAIFSDSGVRGIMEPNLGDLFIVLIAGGLTLVFLGGAALRQNLAHRRDFPQPGKSAGHGSGRTQ